MDYKIIASSSKGNSVYINGNILVDIGIPFKKLNDAIDIKSIDFLLITHEHGDHLNIATLKSLMLKNFSMKIVCGSSVATKLINNNINRNTIMMLPRQIIKLKNTQIRAVDLYHDVECLGYRIIIDNKIKVLYCTDTYTIEHIDASEYDYYFLEGNYHEDIINSFDAQRVRDTHLSIEQAQNFYVMNKKEGSELILLHKSSRNA